MTESFDNMLLDGGHKNSLGKVPEVITTVLADRNRLPELYNCLFDDDAWVRMRAADALEKICREHPDWIVPYIDKIQTELSASTQPSIQWHIAQIYRQVPLTDAQRQSALQWLTERLQTTEVDWIVAANAMDTLVAFTKDGFFPPAEVIRLLKLQQGHKSSAVIRRATKLLATL